MIPHRSVVVALAVDRCKVLGGGVTYTAFVSDMMTMEGFVFDG